MALEILRALTLKFQSHVFRGMCVIEGIENLHEEAALNESGWTLKSLQALAGLSSETQQQAMTHSTRERKRKRLYICMCARVDGTSKQCCSIQSILRSQGRTCQDGYILALVLVSW